MPPHPSPSPPPLPTPSSPFASLLWLPSTPHLPLPLCYGCPHPSSPSASLQWPPSPPQLFALTPLSCFPHRTCPPHYPLILPFPCAVATLPHPFMPHTSCHPRFTPPPHNHARHTHSPAAHNWHACTHISLNPDMAPNSLGRLPLSWLLYRCLARERAGRAGSRCGNEGEVCALNPHTPLVGLKVTQLQDSPQVASKTF